jgi:hypothetical protein
MKWVPSSSPGCETDSVPSLNSFESATRPAVSLPSPCGPVNIPVSFGRACAAGHHTTSFNPSRRMSLYSTTSRRAPTSIGAAGSGARALAHAQAEAAAEAAYNHARGNFSLYYARGDMMDLRANDDVHHGHAALQGYGALHVAPRAPSVLIPSPGSAFRAYVRAPDVRRLI